MSREEHWQKVHQTRAADAVSWYRPHLEVSLALLERAGLNADSRLIDIGGGASTLVDDLLARGVRHLTVLDISEAALAVARHRLGELEREVQWLVADILEANLPAGAFDLWHDRAVFHFLTDADEAARYSEQASNAVGVGGYAIIGGFAPDGPQKCSGLPVARRSAEEIAAILGHAFHLVEKRSERHVTPDGAVQPFAYALLEHA